MPPAPSIITDLAKTGGYTGATQGQIDALRSEIEKLDADIAEWPEQAMEDRRARLAEKLAAMEAELSAHAEAMAAKMADVMARMRAAASAGITIPVRTSGPAIPSSPDRTLPGFSTGGWVGGPGTGTSDSIPAMLSNGEFVVNASAAGRYGALLEAVNSGYPADAFLSLGAGNSAEDGDGSAQVIHLGGVSFQFAIDGSQNPQALFEEFKQIAEREVRDMFRASQFDRN
ncbi:hypothetical protein [Devosia sp. RR2S18]|uniref:hypothetical protein n=1 Tax=Devosia rhizosphaerae TaxID=3049774 RepID=UPI00254137AA|nr:hypothetical protein [Devosia sp. RR2S18]WIJ24996.1 hypothetical protein QOV41_18605 [Devosia sp. RR2S18]